jgi:phosphoglycolate phosphatase/pyrophosphatase PpaX
MTLKYKCLLLDHDDTAIPTTKNTHFPAHLKVLDLLNRSHQGVDLDTWFLKNFDPGIMDYYTKELGFSDDEMELEQKIWREYTTNFNKVPDFFPKLIDSLKKYHEKGGLVVIVSHSQEDIIDKHYKLKGKGFLPDKIYGWNYELKKPNPELIEEIKNKYNLDKSKMILVDDLKPGFLMAKESSIDFGYASWGHKIPQIQEFMKKNATYYLNNIDDFEKTILKQDF